MLSTIVISRSSFFTALGIIALILLVFNPKALWSIIRWIIFIVLSYLVITLKNIADLFGLLVSHFLSKQSWYFEFFGGIETIVVDTGIVFLLAIFLLPDSKGAKLLVAVGGGALCLWNLFHYAMFSFIPFGYDPGEINEINWPFSIVYIVIYTLMSWAFVGLEKKDSSVELA